MHGAVVVASSRVFSIHVGGRKSNGTCPEHHAKGAGGLLRHILQELERVGIVEMDEEKGRKITVRVYHTRIVIEVNAMLSLRCYLLCNQYEECCVLTHIFFTLPLSPGRES